MASAVHWCAEVEAVATFEAAKRRLATAPFDLLASNVRLGAFNGVHLVHLSKLAGVRLPAVLYDEELRLADEAQRCGAFFERTERIVVALGAYVRAALPETDRRSVTRVDRRARVRGGRRAWDLHLLTSLGGAAGPGAGAGGPIS